MNTLRIGCLVVIILCMSELSQGKNDTYSLQLISLKCNIDFEDIHLKAVYMPLGSVSNVAMEYTNGTSFNDSNTWFPFTECSNATKNTLDCKAMDVYDNNTYYIRLTYNNGTHMKLIGPYTPSTYRRQCVTGQPKVVLVKLLSISSTSLTVFAKVSQDAYFTFPVEAIMTLTDPHFSKQKFPCLLKSKEATCVATGLEPANEYKTCVTMFMKFFQKYTSCLTSVTEKAPTTGPTEMTVTTTQTITGRSTTSGVMSTTVLEKSTTVPSETTNMKTDETIDTKTTTTTTATKLATTLPTEITPTDEKITATTTKTTTTANNTITAEKATNVTTATTTTMASTTPLPTEITLTLVNSSCEVKSFYVYLTANFLTDHLDIAKVSMQYRKDLSTWFPIKTSPKEFDTCVRQKFKKVSSITCQVSSIFDPMTYEIDLIYKDLSVGVVDAFVPSQQLCESGSPPVSLLVSAAGLSAITIDSYVPSSKKFGTKTSIVGYDSNNKTVDATKFCKSYGIANISCTWSGLSPCKTYQFCYQSKSKTNGNYTKCSNAKTKGCYVKMNGEHNTINGIALSLYTICGLAIATLVAVSAVWIVRHRNNHRSTGIVRMHGSYENLDSNHSNHQLQVEYHADDERLTLIN